MTTLLIPARAASLQTTTAIDHRMADCILDRLGCTLEDLSIKYGDVIIPSGDITHQLYYGSNYSTANLLGYVWCENGVYFTGGGGGNHETPQQAAIELLDSLLVADCKLALEDHQATAVEYF
jgi:hypothetical protein